jgi:hypothetical protein
VDWEKERYMKKCLEILNSNIKSTNDRNKIHSRIMIMIFKMVVHSPLIYPDSRKKKISSPL